MTCPICGKVMYATHSAEARESGAHLYCLERERIAKLPRCRECGGVLRSGVALRRGVCTGHGGKEDTHRIRREIRASWQRPKK